MKKITLVLLLLISSMFLFPAPSSAKWWLFGKSGGEVGIAYLYLNNMSYEEAGRKAVLFKESMADGLIHIKGKAAVGKGTIGSVRVTVDNKENWQEAKLADNGTFEFSFKPDIDKSYVFYIEATDTAGKVNDVEATRKEVVVSQQNFTQAVKEALDKMIAAYAAEDPSAFMALVSEDFSGDKVMLDRAIRSDFSVFDNIQLTYAINAVVADAKGRIAVSIQFNRSVVSSKSGSALTDRGTTEFIFSMGEKGPQVYSMKNPLIFGLSDAQNVAQGTVQSTTNGPTLVVGSTGDAQTLPFKDAISFINNGGSTTTLPESGTVTLTQRNIVNDFDTLEFSSGSVQGEAGLHPVTGDIGAKCACNHPLIIFKDGMKHKDLGAGSIDSITEVPDESTYSGGDDINIAEDEIFALYLPNGKYALFRVSSSTFIAAPCGPGGCSNPAHIVMQYKYQPDGSKNFN